LYGISGELVTYIDLRRNKFGTLGFATKNLKRYIFQLAKVEEHKNKKGEVYDVSLRICTFKHKSGSMRAGPNLAN
jgi:hypothetical protein